MNVKVAQKIELVMSIKCHFLKYILYLDSAITLRHFYSEELIVTLDIYCDIM